MRCSAAAALPEGTVAPVGTAIPSGELGLLLLGGTRGDGLRRRRGRVSPSGAARRAATYDHGNDYSDQKHCVFSFAQCRRFSTAHSCMRKPAITCRDERIIFWFVRILRRRARRRL